MSFFASMLYGIAALPLAAAIFLIAIQWRLVEKAGGRGWKVLIPVYGLWVQYKYLWRGKLVMFLFLLLIVLTGPMDVNDEGIRNTLIVLMFLSAQLTCAKKFGKSVFFGLGLVFLYLVFAPILAWGKSEYMRKKTPEVWRCKCGMNNPAEAVYCPACGLERKDRRAKEEKRDASGWMCKCGRVNPMDGYYCSRCGAYKHDDIKSRIQNSKREDAAFGDDFSPSVTGKNRSNENKRDENYESIFRAQKSENAQGSNENEYESIFKAE